MPSQVLGSGPVGFTDKDGNQKFIPLSALYFDDKGIQVDGKLPLYNTDNKSIVDSLLERLVAGGFLTPAPNEPPKPAMILKAANPGAAGNNIQVTFSNIAPDKMKFDATITETEAYEGLSFDSQSANFIKTVLGTEKPENSKGGLVHILEVDQPTFPPQAGTYELKLPKDKSNDEDNTKNAFVKIQASSTTFTLEARKPGKDGESTKVTIDLNSINDSAKTFDLKVVWTQTVTGITLGDLSKKLAGSGYLITVELPKKGGEFMIPAPGTVVLSGGADKKEAEAASATVFAS